MACPERKHCREPRRTGRIVRIQREQLMYPPPRQSAAERRVEPLVPGRKPVLFTGRRRPRNPRDIPPHPGKMIHRLAHDVLVMF